MRINEFAAPCRCRDCQGKERVYKMELIANSEEDCDQLARLGKLMRLEAKTEGIPTIEVHINMGLNQRKADAAQNN